MVRIGLVGDTHIPEAGPDLPPEAYDALAGCDRILHVGDLHTIEVVDRLGQLARTVVTRGNGDPLRPAAGRPGVPDDPRIAERFVLQIEGVRIGMTHDLEHAEGRRDEDVAALLARVFEGPVDVAVSGHTHVPMVWGLADGTVLVNPGSPTMPYGYRDIIGTLGFLDIDEGRFEVTVVDLVTGEAQLRVSGPGTHPFQKGPRPRGGR